MLDAFRPVKINCDNIILLQCIYNIIAKQAARKAERVAVFYRLAQNYFGSAKKVYS